jgi:beta-glucosidase
MTQPPPQPPLQPPLPFRDPALPVAERVADLLSRLTVAEKVAMLHQYQPAVQRLGLAAFTTGCEALHGVAWIGRATVFPQAVGLGATWDRELVRRVGAAVSTEVRAFRQDTANAVRSDGIAEKFPMVSLNVWAPVVNLLRDPRWGRNEEGYSEDPYATAELAVAYCRGLRGDDARVWRTAPLLKHFLAYNVETDRDVMSMEVSDRVLHEVELPAFRRPIEAGVVAGVMPGYNLTNGVPNHVHPLIRSALRAWDPELAVCSDAQAPSNLVEREKYFDSHVESHAAALKAGIDSFTDNSADAGPTIERFTAALAAGLVTEAEIETAVGRVLRMRMATGEFDPELDPYAGIRADVIACAEHNALALEAARASVVLLKNAGGVLPLDPSGTESVAVIGHLGSRVLGDWYSGTFPYTVSIAEALQAGTVVDGTDVVMLRAESGEEYGPFRQMDWGTSVQHPDPVHTFQAAGSGRYLSVGEDGTVAATAETPDGWVIRELFEVIAIADGRAFLRSNAVGRFVRVDADGTLIADAAADAATSFALDVLASGPAEARHAAASVDRVVVVVGNDPHINGRETVDRDGLALPAQQEAILRAVCEANPNVVLVVVSSYPYSIEWAAEHVPAIVWTSHGGQELGTAVADVLAGRHNPSGRLPQTWYADGGSLPAPDDYDFVGSGWTYQYSERAALWAFGHGLSYTEFEYSGLQVTADVSGVVVDVVVRNSGSIDGAEVVQVYARSVDGGAERPVRRLQAFEKVELPAGEERTLRFLIPVGDLAFWDAEAAELRVDSGRYEVQVGASSADIRAAAVVTLTAG